MANYLRFWNHKDLADDKTFTLNEVKDDITFMSLCKKIKSYPSLKVNWRIVKVAINCLFKIFIA